ncbi:protein HEG homolog 1 isoform X2 [Nycticebus coucang]|uniref:protein HEG homolog 1 isoform X2 n=1 Tax=Nycticebus coucang TaxID=9470 RepID=UPI00234C1390|nr:protein HEG homolog 1 isoform X2 [Nycticebus coucang]
MASPRASRWPPPPPLLLLLPPLLLLLSPAAPGTRGQPPSPVSRAPSRAPLASAGLERLPELGPERRGPATLGPGQTAPRRGVATLRGPSGPDARGGSAAIPRNHWPESNTEPHTENIPFYQNQKNFSTVASKETSRSNFASSDIPENLTLLTGTAAAGGRRHSSNSTNFTSLPGGDLPEMATAVTSQSNTLASESTEGLNNSTGHQSALVRQTKSIHSAATFTDGVPRMLRSLTLGLGLTDEAGDFTEDSKTATTSVSVHSSLSAVESRRNSQVTGNPGDGEFTEPSTEDELGLTASRWQNDSPTFREHQLASSSQAQHGSSVSQTESESRSFPSTRAGESTAHWVSTNSKTFADAKGSSASYPDVVSASVFTGFSDSAPQTRGRNTVLSDSGYSESWSASSSESLDSSAPPGERSTVGDSRTGVGDRTPRAPPRSAHTSATLAGVAERTLRSLAPTNASTSATPAQSSAGTDVTDGTSLATLQALGVTGISYDQVSGTDTEQRNSSSHTDHTYISSTFTKGERALLSITDNSSSSDIRESSTSYIKSSNPSYSDYSSSSHAQTERSNISSYDGEYAQPSTESPVQHTSDLLSLTSTINMPDAAAQSVGGWSSSPSVPPPPLPSESQSHQFSSAVPSPGASVYLLKSTSDASPPLSSSPSPLPTSMTASTPAPLPVSQTTLPHSSSTLVLPRVKGTPMTSVQMPTASSSLATPRSSQTVDPKNQSTSHQEKIVIESKSPSLVSMPTESVNAVTMSSPSEVSLSPALKESSTEQSLPPSGTSLVPMSPALTATVLEISHPTVTTPSIPSSTASVITSPAPIQTTARKQLLPTRPEILVTHVSTQVAIGTKRTEVHEDATTTSIPLTSVLTSAKELTTRLGIIEAHSPASHVLETSLSPQTTDVSTAEVSTPNSATLAVHSSTWSPTALSSSASVDNCAKNPCLHEGECTEDSTGHGYRCACSPSWQGDNCSVDVNECLSNPCPPLAVCNNTQGSFICKCPVGYQLEKGICNLVRTFVTEFKLKRTFLNTTVEKHSDLQEVENEITKTLNVCFSTLPGYIRSTVRASRESNVVVISLQTTFSMASNVTLFDLADGIQKCVNTCRSSAEVCQLLGSQKRIFRAGSLCKRKSPECDRETSVCTDLDGVALCQCKAGYFQFNKMDHSCRACEDGYRLENETCMSCPFGLGGLNCGNPYQLITVVIATAGGGLLLILGIALIVTCCRKNKNDISKLIFKSGDFQMSPYAEYPKNPRSQEWGREAIEMHENGSTKNLLQMTDVYYSPTSVRNPELERNGLYPAYTGLPGSRHSCIFPGQYNPSFISDESRRRDYF